MSESLNDAAFDLELEDTLPPANNLRPLNPTHAVSVPVRSITNSPGCAPRAEGSEQVDAPSLPPRPSVRPTAETPRNSVASSNTTDSRPIRRARKVGPAESVRVDAWAVPASANWSRTSKTIRKVNRVSRSTDWALPF